ncbi:hypothetical protein ACFQE1_10555 [Halobium palmae]|uniref:Uncharacterized protein n=1 Tax=Halobium palmae TaxID=1776492 RepID=A0ABD5S0L2_9EURY
MDGSVDSVVARHQVPARGVAEEVGLEVRQFERHHGGGDGREDVEDPALRAERVLHHHRQERRRADEPDCGGSTDTSS